MFELRVEPDNRGEEGQGGEHGEEIHDEVTGGFIGQDDVSGRRAGDLWEDGE